MTNQLNFKPAKSIAKEPIAGSLRFRTVIFSLFACLILLMAVAFFTLSFAKPYIGLTLSLNTEGWSIERVTPNGAAYQAGIRAGDIPKLINNQPAETFLGKYTGAGVVTDPLIKQLTTVGQNGQTISVDLSKSTPSPQAVIELTMWLVTSVIFWIVGFYVFFKKPGNLAAKLLCLCGVFFGLTLATQMAYERAIPYSNYGAAVSLAISPFLLLHFFLILPEEREQLRNNPRLYLIYLPAVITIILFPFIGWANGQPVWWFRTVRLVECVLALLAAVGVAVFNYLHTASPRTRQQMRIVAISAGGALVPFLLFTILFPAIWKQSDVPYGFHVLFFCFIPLGMGYAVVTQKLLDIDLVIRRSVIYGGITVIMTLILGAGIFPAVAFWGDIGITAEIFITLLLGIVATVLFGPVKKGTEYLVDRVFYKDKYDYRKTIQELNNSLNRLSESNDISRLVVTIAASSLNLAGACLYVKSAQSSTYDLKAAVGTYDNPESQVRILTQIYNRDNLTEFPNSISNRNPDIEFLIPLVAGDKEVGVLCVSPKATRQTFSIDDIYLLQGIASVAATALRSAMLVHDVSLRSTFVSIASHELRTPLTSVLAFADLLYRQNTSEGKRKTWAKNIYDNAEKLAALVDELLNVARIQSGKTRLKIESVKLPLVLEEQLDMVRPNTDKHEFTVSVEPDLPEVLIDRDKFGHIIGNLLNNAVKYSPNGGHIRVTARHDKERNRIVIAVADDGIGIGPEDAKSLFTTFHRIQRPETAGIGGSGLGLYIAKEWTEAMGGEIWLESELNKGSTFFIGIPAQNSQSG